MRGVSKPLDRTAATADPADLGFVAREMVRLFKEQFGRGPVKSVARWAGPDTIVCVLEETFSPAERKLIDLGQHQAVREMRAVLEHATVPEFVAPVEECTGRKVRGFTSAVDTVANGLAIETWTLHPAGYDGPGRVQLGAERGEVGPDGRREREDLETGSGPVRPS